MQGPGSRTYLLSMIRLQADTERLSAQIVLLKAGVIVQRDAAGRLRQHALGADMGFACPDMGATDQQVVCADVHNNALHADSIGALAVLDAPQQVLRCVPCRHHADGIRPRRRCLFCEIAQQLKHSPNVFVARAAVTLHLSMLHLADRVYANAAQPACTAG